jgi:hypothetical protein
MRFGPTTFRRVLPILAGAMLLAAWTGAASAEETLRWRFKQGEKLNYVMTQDMNMKMTLPAGAGGQGGDVTTAVHQVMDMTWDVQGVNEAGDAVIQQKFDHVQMKMTPSVGPGIDYDSKSDKPAEGLAAMIAPLYDAMTAGEFEMTMSARGEVKDVKIPQQVLDALKNSPGASAMGEMATAEGFQKMIMQGALVLPETTPKEGESWSNKVEMNNPVVGKQIIETSYKYMGTKQVDGATMAVFQPSISMQFEGNTQMKMNVKEQKSDGEVLFNETAGRLDSTKLNQDVNLEVAIGAQTMQQQIKQSIEVKVKPKAE